MAAQLSGLPRFKQLLAALLKWATFMVESSQSLPPDLGRVFHRAEVDAGGLGDEDVQILLDANCIQIWPGNGQAQLDRVRGNKAGQGAGLVLTEEGKAQIAPRIDSPIPAVRPAEANPRQPQWVTLPGGGGELQVGGVVIKRLRRDAQGQILVLKAFQKEEWKRWIANPLDGPKSSKGQKTLRDTVRWLNERQNPFRVRFHVHGAAVGWEIVESAIV
jgi:hypothetical protein